MDFIELLRSGRVIVWDGAMGTALSSKLEVRSSKFKCNEELNLTHPEIIQSIHEDFLNAGALVIETNTFGANRITLAEHGLADKVREINLAAVRVAKQAVGVAGFLLSPPSSSGGSLRKSSHPKGCYSENEHQSPNPDSRFISASIGPTSKLPTLGHISFNEMVAAYREQAAVLLEGGVDIFQIETCQDILQAKAAVVGCKEAFADLRTYAPTHLRTISIIVTITIEPTGTTLLGTEVGAALAALEPLGISAFGLNCATGPAEMEEHIRYIKDNSDLPIAVLPNAGLPEIKNGIAHYPLTPDKFAEWIEYFIKNLGVRIVGGCCGTTPEHIAEVKKRVDVQTCRRADVNTYTSTRLHTYTPFLSSLYSPTPLDQEPRPLIVGERMNINGSKEFREYILAENFDAAAGMAKKQADGGAHVLDLSVAYAGRDEIADMHEMARRLATVSTLPLMIDSTNPEAIEAALSHLGGRSIINSINLEDGGKKAKEIIKIAKRHGSALVALTIDEEGMALTADKKVAIAERLIKFCRDEGGDGTPPLLLIDLLTFTLADPKAAEAGSGRETLEAIKQLKLWNVERERASVRTILGVSNISYGLKPDARRVLNSIFLHEAGSAGLDAEIVHAKQILPLHKIVNEAASLAYDLIFCKHKNALMRFVAHFENVVPTFRSGDIARSKDRDYIVILKDCIIDGEKAGLEEVIVSVLKTMRADEIINKILLPAMQEVGEKFGAGELVLPFVLQSAEVMRAAVDILEPHMDRTKTAPRGSIILATVRGDVHDIGKNLVDIILSNNGYKVINLGVKQTIDNVIKSAQENNSGVIGLSGLLVQSCLVMKEDLAELAHRGITTPVICGGAALTRKFVENDLQNVYGGKVYYAKDAFEGLKIMNGL